MCVLSLHICLYGYKYLESRRPCLRSCSITRKGTVTGRGARGQPVISSDSPVLLASSTSVIGKSDHGPALGPKFRSSRLHKCFYPQGFRLDFLFFMAKKGDLTLPIDFESEIYACLLIEAFALASPHILPDTPKNNTRYTCGHLV